MNKAERIEDFQRMFEDLTDPEKREERKLESERAKRKEERMQDTGYVV